MLVTHKVATVLEQHRDAFSRAAEETSRLQEVYGRAFDHLSSRSAGQIEQRLSRVEWPGARLLESLEGTGPIFSFTHRWSSAQEARSWALEIIRHVPTVAVDGSQIAASKEFGVPLSLIQVAWFENRHDPDGSYVKDLRNEIVIPAETLEEIDDYAFAESKLNQRRFTLEMQMAAETVRSLPPDPVPVVLVDGTLVLSFIGRLAPPARSAYLKALFDLLEASREARIPVVGFVDLSFAGDLITMLKTSDDLPPSNLFDARILSDRMDYFDRTAAFQCARGDVLPHYHSAERDFSDQICFVYIKTGQDRLPARIDFPKWILEAGILDHVIDVIRAEIVAGTGYPYALETADATAVLTTEDRLGFYKLYHDFAQESGLNTSLPGKSISKIHRR